ncbi:high-affinity glucose transporter [Pseudomassariella vexata]|uniref:High-affinity glucose transporter n=1 Tax=Pseudomassariella vexata TaxID=1141098 RepID=A0A1Y2DDB7_9PEZI|nr:high-affinity glucose transporter [Pseudomassariella vexata]ORY57260.1 high-affinity glucose transporter [Pseudomassariella vexata]
MWKIGNVYFIAAIAVIGGALFGFDISSMSAIISTQPYLCQFNSLGMNENGECRGPSSNTQGGITAAMPAGSWLGALVSGFVSDRFGRKTSIQVGSIIWIIGSIIVCASVNIPMLIVGRIINGLSVGICSAQVPVYISELAPPSKRGRLVGLQQWASHPLRHISLSLSFQVRPAFVNVTCPNAAITWGIAILFFICYGSSFLKGTAAFRLPWGIQMIPGLLLFLGLLFLPESPRWLAKKDRWDESLAVLTLVHGHGDANSPWVAKEMAEIREMVEFERQNSDVTYWELIKPQYINRTHIGIFTQIWSQLTGMNVMMYYITYVFTMAGLGSDILLPSGIQFIINVVMTVPALLFMDRWGRRPTLLVGAFLMCLFLCVNAGLFAVYSRVPRPEDNFTSESESMAVTGAPSKAIIAMTYLFVASYAPTWGPVSWTYPPELYSLRHRGKAVSLATSANWAFNFALAWFVPPAFAQITWRVYVVFAVFCFAMFWHVFFIFPETSGKTLEEIAGIFDDTQPGAIRFLGQPAWKTKNTRQQIVRAERNQLTEEEKLGGFGDNNVSTEHKA